MKKNNLILSVLTVLTLLPSSAQEISTAETFGSFGSGSLTSFNPITYRNLLFFLNARDHKNSVNEAFYESVTGTPYLNDTFLPAIINSFKEVASARYDAYKDLIVVKIKNLKGLYLEKRIGNKVTFMNNNEVYQIFYSEDEDEKVRFFKVIFSKHQNFLLVKQEVKLKGGKKPTSSYDNYVPAFFKRVKDKLYLSLDGRNAVKVPSSKKKFYQLFSEDAHRIKNFAKKDKLHVKKKEDLIKILDFYSEL